MEGKRLAFKSTSFLNAIGYNGAAKRDSFLSRYYS